MKSAKVDLPVTEVRANTKNNSVIHAMKQRVPLEGAVNFRDLGGYLTSQGKRIKNGRVFRSDSLARLSSPDLSKLIKMNIKTVCDFRTAAEQHKAPNKFPSNDSTKYLHLPVAQSDTDNTILFERLKNGDVEWINIDFMINGYIRGIEKFAGIWGKVIKLLADPGNCPLIFHCTAGKDRTGTCAALILLLLDVPEQTVIDDHGLSNVFIAAILDKIYARMKSAGIDPDLVSPYFTAPKECIIELIRHLHRNYGSAYNYFIQKAKVRPETIESLKKNLLEAC